MKHHLRRIRTATRWDFRAGAWLEILQAQSKAGELKVADGEHQCRLLIHKGQIRSIQMPHLKDDLRLGSLLVRSQRITTEQQVSALLLQRTTSRPLGEVLL